MNSSRTTAPASALAMPCAMAAATSSGLLMREASAPSALPISA